MTKDPTRRSISEAMREVAKGVQNVLASELKLAKAEAGEAFSHASRNSLLLTASALVACLAVVPFLAFLVIGLGRILGDNYWLSSLIVSAVLSVGGGIGAFSLYRGARFRNLSLPETRQSMDEQRHALESKVRELVPRGNKERMP